MCDEKRTKNEEKQCATCAAVLKESISGESRFAQNDELRRWATITKDHRPCSRVPGFSGIHRSSQSSRKSRHTPSESLRKRGMINSLNIEPSRRGENATVSMFRLTLYDRTSSVLRSSSSQSPLTIAATVPPHTASEGEHLAKPTWDNHLSPPIVRKSSRLQAPLENTSDEHNE